MNDIDLHRWLAAQLPDEIDARYEDQHSRLSNAPWRDGWCFYWRDTAASITPREWLHVVSLVEAKLTDEQHGRFRQQLQQLTMRPSGFFNDREWFSPTWQQRAQALMEVLK